jgi:hypothetical protein
VGWEQGGFARQVALRAPSGEQKGQFVMNTLGKILVFLNLLFALLVAGFLAIDFQTRTNWKQYAEQGQRNLEVARKDNATLHGTNIRLRDELQKIEKQLKTKDEGLAKLKTANDLKRIEMEASVAKTNQAFAAVNLSLKQAKSVTDRLASENLKNQQIVKIREQAIIKAEQQRDEFFAQMQQAINERDATLQRNSNLVARLRELEVRLAKLSVTGGAGTTVAKGSPNEPNPPTNYVKGTITSVDSRYKDLVQISLGSDQGLQVGHTLEAYRLDPPEYLGMLKIMEVNPYNAVARVVRTDNFTPLPTLRKGDQVSSRIISH